jgi:hypothetical protein
MLFVYFTHLQFALQKWKICFVVLMEEHGLKVFRCRVLRQIFGHKQEKGTGGRRKDKNGEVHYLQPAPNIIRQIK